MPTSEEDVPLPQTITGRIRRYSGAKKELLSHTNNVQELDAARYVWNHPEKMRYVGNSPLGQGKDKTDIKDRKNIGKKKGKGVVSFSRYYFEYRGKTWLAKAARYKRGYETLYHIKEA